LEFNVPFNDFPDIMGDVFSMSGSIKLCQETQYVTGDTCEHERQIYRARCTTLAAV